MAIAPLVAWGQTLGAVVLASARRGYHYGPRELTLIRELALRVAMTLNNSCLYQRSVRASRARDEVLAVVSHDLRNPLESASLGAMLLRDLLGTGTQAEVGETLERMNRSLERAKRLVSDLLDATRAEAGQLEMSFQEEDPASLAREALDLQREKAADKSVSLKRDLSTVEGRIRADRHRVLQVLTNLLDNAIRHTPSGGSVTLRVRASRLGARFSVIDTGEGIGPADLPHVFDRFWTAGGKKAGGVGLGLPISKAVVEAHGGRIKAESKPGAGATFRFFIPWGED